MLKRNHIDLVSYNKYNQRTTQMTTYKAVTRKEIFKMISTLQVESLQKLMFDILNREYSKTNSSSVKLLKDLRRQTGLDLLHTTGDLFLIRYVN